VRVVFAAFLSLVASVVMSAVAPAQVPTFRDVTGHDFGERVTLHPEMVRYLERLAATSPRVTVHAQGRSWEGRALMLAVVTSPANHARLEAIREGSLALADGRRTGPEAARPLIADQPVVVWFGGSIHGFELSGAEGALKLLERLATADDPATLAVLDATVVLVDPMLNPDGREAFATLNHEQIGRQPTADPRDWSNDFTRWQAVKFRTGHYYFDTNRDWFAQTQAETRERMPTLHAWRPQVAVDMHEMGAGSEFYFDPPGPPYNPYFPEFARRWFGEFGAAYAAAFDSAGFEYMTRERYNYFYPGYTSNRGYQGAVAMLFEQGSSRGLALERPDKSVRTLADALEQQYVAAWTAVQTAAQHRERLLTEYYESQRAALARRNGEPVRYLVTNDRRPGLVRELITLLRRNDVEVDTLTTEVAVGAVVDRDGQPVDRRTFAAGTYVVESRQPASRLIGTLLDPSTPLPEEFLTDARSRVLRDENPRFYDITAWSLPLLFDVAGFSTTDSRELPVRALAAESPPAPPVTEEQAAYAYVVDGRDPAAMSVLAGLTGDGYRAAVLTAPTRIDGRDVAGGSVVVRVGQNDATVHDAVRRLGMHHGVGVDAVASGLGEPGRPSLGSGDHTFNVEAPRIALLGEDPIAGYSFGWAWYTLDRQYEIPLTVLRTGSVAETDLSPYTVLVIPSTSAPALARVLGETGAERMVQWVRDGGTLVTIGAATDFARTELKVIALRSWYETDDGKDAQRFDVPGAILRAEIDRGFWLAAGYDDGALPMLVDSDRLYLAPEGAVSSRRRVVARYAADDPVISGHVWEESRARIPGTVAVYEERVGDGRVIAFAEDPNYRAYFRGANRLFLNAVVLGPSAP
jgi:hypothetical protein